MQQDVPAEAGRRRQQNVEHLRWWSQHGAEGLGGKPSLARHPNGPPDSRRAGTSSDRHRPAGPAQAASVCCWRRQVARACVRQTRTRWTLDFTRAPPLPLTLLWCRLSVRMKAASSERPAEYSDTTLLCSSDSATQNTCGARRRHTHTIAPLCATALFAAPRKRSMRAAIPIPFLGRADQEGPPRPSPEGTA